MIVDSCCPTNCLELICPTNIVVACQPNNPNGQPGAMIPMPAPTVTNHCGTVPAGVQLQCFPPVAAGTPTYFPPGTNTVTCCLTTPQGLTNCCCFQVIVTNCPTAVIPCRPQIICPTNINVQCNGTNGANVFFLPPTIVNPCGLPVNMTCSYTSGALFPNGKTTVSCCIRWVDPASGLIQFDCCCFDVIVECCATPCVTVLNCSTNLTLPCHGAAGTFLNYVVTGTNTCFPTTLVCNPPPGAIIFGSTNVCCKLLNTAGLVLTQCCFSVTLTDTNAPTLTCPQDITVTSPNCQPVPVTFPLPIAVDNCDPNPTVTCSPLLTAYPCGVTIVTCTAVDNAGNVATCAFRVIVVCPGGPQITCPPDITISCASPTGAVVNWTVTATNVCTNIVSVTCLPPTASDNCALDHVRCTPALASPFPVGTTLVTCCAFDVAGNSNCCTFRVTVICPPTNCVQVICPTNILVGCAPASGAVVTYNAFAVDLCTHTILPALCSPPSGSTFPIGTTQVCCTNITLGVIKYCCFDVTVLGDTNAPVINCPSNIYVFCSGTNGTKVNYRTVATDDCTAAPLIVCVPAPNSLFKPGCTNVVCTATDAAGNTSTCTFKVCVLLQGCYLLNPSFEQVVAGAPVPAACGDLVSFAANWTALAGTPDLWRPPFATLVPGNCRGRENPCHGTNYAGLEGATTPSGSSARRR